MTRRAIPFLVATLAALLASAALAQIELTEFQSGTPIVADEMNANFDAVVDAIESNRARLDAIETGTLRVTPIDMVPLNTFDFRGSGVDLDYIRDKDDYLGLAGEADDGAAYFCFAARIDPPDGSTLTTFAATMSEDAGSGDIAEAVLYERPWDDAQLGNENALATVDQFQTTFGEEIASGGDLPVVVDTDANEYRVEACLQRRAGFLGARVEYELP